MQDSTRRVHSCTYLKPSITVVIVVSFSSGFNFNIHISYKFVYFYFELLLSTDIHLPMNFFLNLCYLS